MSALSKTQKAILAQLSERAFNLGAARLRGDGRRLAELSGLTVQTAPNREAAMDLLLMDGRTSARGYWRHEQVKLAVGKDGLRCCDQNDYKRVEAYFLDLIGRPGAAFNAHMRAEGEGRRQWEFLLKEACAKWGFNLAYANQICRTQYRKNLAEADERIFRNLVSTINNRGIAKRERERQQEMEIV